MKKIRILKKTTVFIVSAVICVLVCLFGVLSPDMFAAAANNSMGFLTGNFAWLYCLAMTAFVVFCIWIGFFSRFKNVRLGDDDSKPEYRDITWFSMLFSAGMGIGLVFWGVAEPLNYYLFPPGSIEAGSADAERFAFAKSYLHWGIHPWATYSVLALAMAYMQYRCKKPALISSVFIPLLGEERVKGFWGKTIDILAVIATVGGVATSLGLGVLQINSGLRYLFNIPETQITQLVIIITLSFIYIFTAVKGIDRGISLVCNLNVKIAIAVMVALTLVGPTTSILNNLMEGLGIYLSGIVKSSFELGAFEDAEWYRAWTIFYWAWWISWAPFTGSFIARISKGRTISEFIKGVLFIPAGFSVIWFAIFGTLSINLDLETCREAVVSSSTALFVVLSKYPMGTLISGIIFILICTFFVTSANSATYVLGMYCENGALEPSNWSKAFWGTLIAVLGATVMFVTDDGLGMLQTLSIVSAFPFTVVMIISMFSLVRALRGRSAKEISK